ncbi:MAG: diguanylate cyclase [Bacilli bacterium]|nr:diguanylate cyclase [Bacilli bacterium]MBP3445583.1 diguanylate cyclase [Bacilli bacterium]
MKKKRIIIISLIVVLVSALAIGLGIFLSKQDKKTTLTILEKQWIEENKNDIIDLSIVNNIPVFNYDGKGVFFDFIDSIENVIGLNFNKLSYDYGKEPTSSYAFEVKDKLDKNDILIYEDNYVILTKNKIKYNNIDEIDKLTIGVLDKDLTNVNYYLKQNDSLLYKSYSNISNLLLAINDKEKGVDAIILPKTMYLKEIIEKDNFNISYNITEMKKYYVLKLGDNKKLNKIIKKYFNKWYKENYIDSYNENFSNDYFQFKQIYEQEKVNFRSKRYAYAFIEYAPYDSLVDNNLVGINYEMIKGFAKLSDIEISYEKYKNYEELVKAFNENKVDFYLNTSSLNKYDMDVYESVSAYNEQIVVLSKLDKNITINSVSSLKDYDVITLKNSKIEKYLSDNEISSKSYDNLETLLNKKKNNEIIVIDKATYDVYMYDALKNYKIDNIFSLDTSYNYISRDIEANKVFNEYFDFYISFINENEYKNNIKYTMFDSKITNNKPLIIVIAIFILLIISSSTFLILKLKPKKQKISISKEDKLKYIDMLTSLKNRNYLNDSMEKWDSSEIYPQAIVVVDLNNVAYINDNYGHEEGDNIIKEAAAILIKTQIENTEIMRTNGNEFLIYMVEYEEKQVVSYIRKLNKEMKELNHGFGAAIGYSMIYDELKTIDDAINEATLDMKNNKEEIQN